MANPAMLPGPTPARRRAVGLTLAAVAAFVCLLSGVSAAQEGPGPLVPPSVEGPLRVDPAVCTPARGHVWLPFGSERIAVTGVDASGDCIVELFAEMEGGYAQEICRFAPDATAFPWDPFARLEREADQAWDAAMQPFCETVATGNFLMPGAEPVVFPRTPWREARDVGSDAAEDDR